MSADSLDFNSIFRKLPERYIIFTAKDNEYRFVEVSDAHREMTGFSRTDIIGHKFFDVFPDTSDEYKKTGKSLLHAVFKEVVSTKQPVTLKSFRYDIPDRNGNMLEKYWEPVHHPILDDSGEVTHIFQISKDVTEEHTTSKQLAETKRTLDRALKTASLGAWSWDIVNDVITGDENLANFFNVQPKAAATGLPLETFIGSIHADDRERVTTEIEKSIQLKTAFDQDYRTINTHGDITWVTARGVVETDESGKAIHFPGMLIDITARKKAEDELRQSVKRFQALADSMPQLVWVTRPDGYHEYYNQAWYDYTGTTFEQVKGTGWNGAFHPDDQERSAKVWKRSLKTGEPYEIDYRLRYKDGTYRWFVGRALPYKNERGVIEKWYGTCTYIDTQKRAADRQALLSSASKILNSSLDYKKTFRKLAAQLTKDFSDWCSIELYSQNGLDTMALTHSKRVESSHVQHLKDHGIGAHTLDGNYSRTAILYSTITDQLIESSQVNSNIKPVLQSLDIESAIYVPLELDGVVLGAIAIASSKLMRPLNDDDLKFCEELASRMSMALTNASLFKSAQDEIKSRKKLEAQLIEANENLENKVAARTNELEAANTELKRSNQELQNFAYVASHDLQEPLRKIQAFGDILDSEYSQELGDGADYLTRMQAAAARMSVLINDLLSFSRVATQKKPAHNVDLNIVLANVTEDLYTRIEDTNGTITSNTLPTIVADEVQMRQLFQNIIGNALKFHKPHTDAQVTISAQKLAKFHKITITDNGIGFDQKYADKIFAVFQRLHGRNDYEGTGIGLAVCRKIVEQHNGTIEVKSSPGNGAEFIIKLPLT